MKIRVAFTIDIDQAAWASEYGIEKSQVRKDVQIHVQNLAHGAIAQLGLLADEADNREWA